MLKYSLPFLLILDVNECASRPCLHGGTCSDNVNNYTCTCVIGYVGTACETGLSNILKVMLIALFGLLFVLLCQWIGYNYI